MKYKLLIIISLTLLACGSTPPKKMNSSQSDTDHTTASVGKILKSVTPGYKEKFAVGSPVKIGYSTVDNIDSVLIFVEGARILGEEYTPDHVGKISYKVVAYNNGKDQSLNGQFTVLAKNSPQVQKIRIVRKYPHDPKAYTQGLLFHNGRMFESTGERGRSSIREVNLETGKVLRKRDLEQKYFGEGLALLNDKLYQLTWEEGVVFVYDLNDFQKRTQFPISGEGWGITTDGAYLYVTDGSNKISKYDPVNFKKISHIEVADNKQIIENLNELEWINGKIWANVYTAELIAIIDPTTGIVEKYLDCRELSKQIGNASNADVLNGIAFDKATGRVWLTGKDWDTLFEVAL